MEKIKRVKSLGKHTLGEAILLIRFWVQAFLARARLSWDITLEIEFPCFMKTEEKVPDFVTFHSFFLISLLSLSRFFLVVILFFPHIFSRPSRGYMYCTHTNTHAHRAVQRNSGPPPQPSGFTDPGPTLGH